MGTTGEGENVQQLPLLRSFSSPEDEDGQLELSLKRTGTTWTAVAHIITGVIGAGVLSLAWSVAQLGWVAGPLLMIAFALITILSARLLCDCYRYPDPEYGPSRVGSYMEAVGLYLGEKRKMICGIFVHESLYGCGIAYTITSAVSMSLAFWRKKERKETKRLRTREMEMVLCDVSLRWRWYICDRHIKDT